MDTKLLVNSMLHAHGLTNRSSVLRLWKDRFRTGGPRMHMDMGQPVEARFGQDYDEILPVERTRHGTQEQRDLGGSAFGSHGRSGAEPSGEEG